MSDLISRQDAIDAIHCYIVVTGRENAETVAATIGTFVDRIKALPSADITETEECQKCQETVDRVLLNAKRGWIPVSEGLPNETSEYFVTKTDHITNEHLIDIAHYGEWIQENNGFYKADKVIAWMPLPEPYGDCETCKHEWDEYVNGEFVGKNRLRG